MSSKNKNKFYVIGHDGGYVDQAPSLRTAMRLAEKLAARTPEANYEVALVLHTYRGTTIVTETD